MFIIRGFTCTEPSNRLSLLKTITMTREKYLEIRNDESADIAPVMFYYYNKKARYEIDYRVFIEALSMWLSNPVRFLMYSSAITKVFTELDKEFL